MVPSVRRPIPWLLFGLIGLSGPIVAQTTYRSPPEIVRTILDAPRLSGLVTSPSGDAAALAERAGMPTIRDLSQPMLRLAGLRFNPSANARHTTTWYKSLTLRELESGDETPVEFPLDARLSLPMWSPDNQHLAITNTTESGLELYVIARATGEASRINVRLNSVTQGSCSWMPNSTQLLCNTVPSDRGAAPTTPTVPSGPIVQHTSGPAAPVRTYQDLLQSPFDEEVFRHYATGQLALIDVTSNSVSPIGEPGVFLQVDPSPNGERVLVRRVLEPFSYLVPVSRFAQEIELWDAKGNRVAGLASIPLADQVPINGVRVGRRNFEWQPGEDATLVFVEALDGGDTRSPADLRDRVAILAPPHDAPIELTQLAFRYAGIRWGADGMALLSEFEQKTRHTRTWVVHPGQSDLEARLLFDRSAEDRYADPGSPMMKMDATGHYVLAQSDDDRSIFLRGAGASPEGDSPFIDRLDLETGETERLWQSASDAYETVVALLDTDGSQVVTRREDKTTPPNYLLRSLTSGAEPIALTNLLNPAPELANVRREIVTYEREDGVGLSGTLYYPTDYREGDQVPIIFWIYPREYASAAAASQVRGSPNRFVLPSGASHLFLLTQGYAVLDNPTLPVIGEGDSANDTYQEQTVAGAKAAVEYLVERGISDGNFGVGGHSYGAFATTNLLAHSDLFRAGVARSGAYNRTLTPFGFQREPRTFWEAPELYLKMMPFSYANRINEPLLLVHGMADNNSGTFPVQSARMYHALKGHGATVEYVQLPFESHGYRARESIMDVLARTIEWFDRYVKVRPPTS